MIIRRPVKEEFTEWLNMRIDLWPDCPRDEHIYEMSGIYDRKPMDEGIETEILVCEVKAGELGGFVELSLRSTLNNFDSSPVGYIEGWYVKEALRGKGLGRMLIDGAEKWAIDKGCIEMASDAEKDNSISIEAHKRIGYIPFGTTEGEILFKKRLCEK